MSEQTEHWRGQRWEGEAIVFAVTAPGGGELRTETLTPEAIAELHRACGWPTAKPDHFRPKDPTRLGWRRRPLPGGGHRIDVFQ